MSTRSTVIWLLVAIVLGGIAFLMLRSTGGGPGGSASAMPALGERLIDFYTPGVTGVRIDHPDGSVEDLRLGAPQTPGDGGTTPGAGEWSMRVRPAGAAAEPAADWPVASGRVQAMLRHLADLRVRALPDARSSPADPRTDVVTLRVVEPAGQYGADVTERTITFRFDSQSVAGKAAVHIEDSIAGRPPRTISAITDDLVHLLFRGNAPREWRDRTALHGAGLDASRISLANDQGARLALGRVEAAWGVREPIAAPADPAVVQRLLTAVTAVQIVDFLDQGVTEASARLDRPAATVVLETDRAGAPPIVHRLEIGGAADAAGTRLFARINGRRTVVIDARAVADLKLEPTLYVWPFPTRLNAADIGTIALEPASPAAAELTPGAGAVFKRDLDRWRQIRADGQEVLLPETETRPVLALLGFLCGPPPTASEARGSTGAPAGPLSISASPADDLRPWGRIALLSLSGAPLDSLGVLGQDSRPGTVTIRSGSIDRTYALDRVPSLIARLAPLPAAPADPAVGQVPESGK